jgi:hypothetical protein
VNSVIWSGVRIPRLSSSSNELCLLSCCESCDWCCGWCRCCEPTGLLCSDKAIPTLSSSSREFCLLSCCEDCDWCWECEDTNDVAENEWCWPQLSHSTALLATLLGVGVDVELCACKRKQLAVPYTMHGVSVYF